ncbi:MAG TPA: response regulator transcription factor [Bacillota bacterium]|nr:response regulator transcription factor [Bacillota bacterium]
MKKVLVVDDDPNIVEVLRLYFDKDGFAVISCLTGERAVETFQSANPDLVVLDLMLPGKDGYDICREIRKTSDVPIIMLTARTDTLDKVVGLELGADDYVQKPFEPKELLARVKAVLRRTDKRDTAVAQQQEPQEVSEIISYIGFTVDKARYCVTVDGTEIDMPPKELELLFFLASHPNRVFTREQLLENVWGYDFYGESRTVDVHVKRIREKIENPDRETNWQIKTVWGVGYKFETTQTT